MKSVHEELTDISIILLDLVDLIEVEPVINERLEQIIKKLGNIYKTDEIIIAREVEKYITIRSYRQHHFQQHQLLIPLTSHSK